MNKALKAALLSAIIFPGSGQIYLKRYGRGLLMMSIVVLGLAIIIVRTTIVALNALKAMPGDGATIDINAISQLAEKLSANIYPDNTVVLMFIAVCWIFSVADAYRIGKKTLPRAAMEKKYKLRL